MSNSNLELIEMSEASETSRGNDLKAELSPKDVTKFRLNEINKIKDYLNAEIKERKDIIKKNY